jgi:hypothetical protein
MKTTYQAYYQYELKKLIDEHIDRLKEGLVNAYHIENFDFSGYRHHVGKIEGLRLALELCEEADAIANGKEK